MNTTFTENLTESQKNDEIVFNKNLIKIKKLRNLKAKFEDKDVFCLFYKQEDATEFLMLSKKGKCTKTFTKAKFFNSLEDKEMKELLKENKHLVVSQVYNDIIEQEVKKIMDENIKYMSHLPNVI